jgi:hypothetical protein
MGQIDRAVATLLGRRVALEVLAGAAPAARPGAGTTPLPRASHMAGSAGSI